MPISTLCDERSERIADDAAAADATALFEGVAAFTYVRVGDCVLVHGDCRAVMAALLAQTGGRPLFDCVLTDPPFGVGQAGKRLSRSSGSRWQAADVDLAIGEWDQFANRDEFLDFTRQWVHLAAALLKPDATFISWFEKRTVSYLCEMLEAEGFMIKHLFADCIRNPALRFRKVNWCNAWLVGVIAARGTGTYQWQWGQHLDWWTRPVLQRSRTGHPTAKPLLAVADLLRWWCPPGGWVLDPFVGSGTTLAAARSAGMKAVGIERDAEFATLAARRLSYAHHSFL